MKYLDLSKPHGFLIWKGKQRAIVSPNPLPVDEKMLIIQDGKEAFGEVILSNPSHLNLTEFERLEEEHSIRPEERKLKWPTAEKFYFYRFKDFQPFADAQDVQIKEGQAEVLPPLELTEAEQKLLEMAERLPKVLVLQEDAVILQEGNVIFCEGLDGTKVMPILEATLEENKENLPLYQLALVRIPRLKLKKKIMEEIMELEDEKAEGTKPYSVVNDHADCSGHAVIKDKDGKLMGCHDTADDAAAQVAALYAEDKGGVGSGRYPRVGISRDTSGRAPSTSRGGGTSNRAPSPKQPKKAGSRKELAKALVEALVDEDEDEKELLVETEPTETDEKELSLENQAREVRDAFYKNFGPKRPDNMVKEESYAWASEVFDDHIVARQNDKLYKITYIKDENGQLKFADKSNWAELQVQLVPTGNVGAKDAFEGYAEGLKSFGEWVDDYYSILDNPEAVVEDAVKAVWAAKYVNDLPDSSFLYVKPDCGEKDEMGLTKPRSCRMFPVKDKEGNVDMPHLRNAIARAPQSNLPEDIQMKIQNKARSMLKEDEKAGRKVRKTMMEKLKTAWDTIKEFMDWAEPMDDEEEMKFFDVGGESAIGIKKVGDDWWYITYSTNAFKDREKEIFSTKSLEKYVIEAEKKEDRGYFNLWHIPGTDFAEKKWQGVAGRFLIEAGPFLKDEKGKAALKFFKDFTEGHKELAPEGWGCSPEYRYLPEERKKGIYENIWITRTSTLPKMAAANIWTQGGITMALTKEQEKAAELIFGEELTKEIVSKAEGKTKELEEAGVAHKSAEEEVKEEEKKEVTLETVVEALSQKMAVDWEPVKAMVEELVNGQKTLAEQVKALQEQTSKEAAQEAEKAKQESPKYVWRLFERASEAEKTIVAEGDKLIDKKPTEAAVKDKSGASAFFN